MNHIWILFLLIKHFFYLSLCLATNPLNEWIDKHSDVLESEYKSVSFNLNIDSKLLSYPIDSIIIGKIIVSKEKMFRFEMGPRIVVSNGENWKSYDKRTNQIFIHHLDKKIEKSLFAWVTFSKIKSLPVKLENDGGYSIKLFGKGNDVRAFFDSDSAKLKSIIINQQGVKSELYNISISSEELLDLNIGNDSSEVFDFR